MLRQAVFAQRVADPETAIVLEEPDETIGLTCDARMVGQGLTNLLKNAGEAISARRLKEPDLQGRIVARLILIDGAPAFEVEDNGIGLPSRDRDRLTEPYVTTREKGTGLGLAIVKRIMEDHGGDLVLSDAAVTPGARTSLRFARSSRVQMSLAKAPATERGSHGG